ncbi:GFA family protein [Microbulbifer sp. GL-2]|uniref:GFA family protein n=1 Tax=Microbulbifer sp. GL-2 TaxID=2591606 RepID=UPI001163F295|nr:GFA family protein [Microbulbifer sp. GL-2]BBM03229.1 S-(hydroxymethyl)glutathione synthase [Microbulbifer sp. GL-2]
MTEIANGSCNCGSVNFRISVIPEDVYICHCSICRKATGGGGIAVTVIANESFEWGSGQDHIKIWRKPNHDWQTSFCSECGSSLPGKNDDKAMYVPVSLLDTGFERLKVKQHLFLDSKAVWEEVDENSSA